MAAKTLTTADKKGKGPAVGKEERRQYPFFSLLKDMNTMIDNFFQDFGMAPARQTPRAFNPSVDVVDAPGELTVTAELPGMTQGDIDVSLTGDTLTIRGEKKTEREDKAKGYHLVERSFGSFTRSIPLPVEVKADEVKAAFRNGVLTITLPKTQRALEGTKKVPIKTE
jgi:HSP20 family protein